MSLDLDGELPPAQVADLRIHMQGCLACQQYRDAMERVAMLLAEPAGAVPPAGFVGRVMGRIQDKSGITEGQPCEG
ncbi:MAG: zf-HC2 domain-containing protein [Chloroflexi bacterium]|nr:zf-HC2 domain-containing protein [Chloroflexota bacterium]